MKAQVVPGDAAFVERFKPLLKEKEQVVLFVNAETKDLRDRLIHEAHVTHRYILAEIGRHLGLRAIGVKSLFFIFTSIRGVSIRRRGLQRALENDPKPRELFTNLETRISQ